MDAEETPGPGPNQTAQLFWARLTREEAAQLFRAVFGGDNFLDPVRATPSAETMHEFLPASVAPLPKALDRSNE